MRTDIDKVYHWMLSGEDKPMPYKRKTMLKLLDQIEKHIKKAYKDLESFSPPNSK